MQLLFKMYTIVCAALISSMMIGYFFGSDTFFMLMKDVLFEMLSTSTYHMVITVCTLSFFVIYLKYKPKLDKNKMTGVELKTRILKRGMFFKYNTVSNQNSFTVFAACHVLKLYTPDDGWLEYIMGLMLVISVFTNLAILYSFRKNGGVDLENLQKYTVPPTNIEILEATFDVNSTDARLADKEGKNNYDFLSCPEFWSMAISRFTVQATCGLFLSFSELLSLQDVRMNMRTQRFFSAY
jgi:hypothetical protein